ncbi:hypothetical protein C0993_003369 [Termitomyces sp. T159_Od127]|nr:hypothetical protein C0993_003369 [Termitomyces sp. T159_Od127]
MSPIPPRVPQFLPPHAPFPLPPVNLQNINIPPPINFIPPNPIPQHIPIPPPVSPPIPIANPVKISITETKLPSLATIPLLKSSADWVSWISAVTRIVSSIGLCEHICWIPVPGDLIDPTSCAVLPPPYDFDSSPEDIKAYHIFWANDKIADHVLVGKLSNEIANSLPSKRGGPYDLPICTAHDTLLFLQKCFSVESAVSADVTKDKVLRMSTSNNSSQVLNYIEAWRTAVNQLSGSPWDFTPFQRTQKFVNGLPTFDEYAVIRERVCSYWHVNNSFDLATFDFNS